MNRRHLLVALTMGLSLVTTPAFAKKKAPPVAPAPALIIAVNPDQSHDPDNVLLLDLSNGGRIAIRLVPAFRWRNGGRSSLPLPSDGRARHHNGSRLFSGGRRFRHG